MSYEFGEASPKALILKFESVDSQILLAHFLLGFFVYTKTYHGRKDFGQ
jgi:hypothetical protein